MNTSNLRKILPPIFSTDLHDSRNSNFSTPARPQARIRPGCRGVVPAILARSGFTSCLDVEVCRRLSTSTCLRVLRRDFGPCQRLLVVSSASPLLFRVELAVFRRPTPSSVVRRCLPSSDAVFRTCSVVSDVVECRCGVVFCCQEDLLPSLTRCVCVSLFREKLGKTFGPNFIR